MMSGKKLVRNFITLFGGNVLGQVFFFIGFAFLARTIGPASFGEWNFAQVCMLYLLRAGEFGLEVIGIRDVARDPARVSTLITTTVVTRLILAIILFLGTLAISSIGLFPEGTSNLVVISALTLFPMAVLLEWVYEANQEVGLISVARIIKGLFFLTGILLLISSGDQGMTAAYIYVASVGLPAVGILIVTLRRFGFSFRVYSRQTFFDSLSRSLPIGIATLLAQFTLSVATIFLGYFVSREQLGYFTAAHRIVLFLWAYIITSLHRILLPNLSRMYRDEPERFRPFIEEFFRLSVIICALLAIVFSYISSPFMTLLYSTQFQASGPLFRLLIWGFILASIRTILEIGLLASDHEHRYTIGVSLLACLYAVVTPVQILMNGITGAAISIVMCELIYLVGLISTSLTARTARLLEDLWKPAAGLAVAFLPMIVAEHLNPLIAMVFGVVGFCTTIALTKGISSSDIGLIRSVLPFSSNRSAADAV